MLIDTSHLLGSNAVGAVTETVNGSSAKVWALRLANVTGSLALTFDNDTTTMMASNRTNGSITTTGQSYIYICLYLPIYLFQPLLALVCRYPLTYLYYLLYTST